MPNAPYCVFVVLDDEYGTRILELVMNGPVWIVDTSTNRAAAETFWKAFPGRSHLDGVTLFASGDQASTEASLLAELDTIDLHHNEYSADPPYSRLEVIGTSLSEAIRAELSQYGFTEFFTTSEGFCAKRPTPQDGHPA